MKWNGPIYWTLAGFSGHKNSEITGNSFYSFNSLRLPPLEHFTPFGFLGAIERLSREAFLSMSLRSGGQRIVEDGLRAAAFRGLPPISKTEHGYSQMPPSPFDTGALHLEGIGSGAQVNASNHAPYRAPRQFDGWNVNREQAAVALDDFYLLSR